MTSTFKPATDAQVLDAVKWAVADKQTLEIVGNASKRGFGRPVEADQRLDMSGLAEIVDYQPSELYITAKAGTPLAAIDAALAAQNQQLMFEPPDYGPLLGGAAGQGTVGGLIACNLAGSRRIKAGAARDHLLGFHAVSGRGEVFKSGGQVVKNVTGFDLSKLMTGSYGTLAVITEATLKVLPAADKVRTVLIHWPQNGVYDHGGVQAMTEALGSVNEVSGAAHLPAHVAARSAVDYVSGSGSAVTALRVEGPGPSVAYRVAALHDMLSKFGKIEELHSQNSKRLWKEISDVEYFADNQERALWRISVPPVEGARVALHILEGRPGEVFYDWGGGLVWLSVEPADKASQAQVRRCVGDVGGHATLVRGSAELRASVAVFEPLDAVLSGVTERIKDGFDPGRLLNPGRMYEGV
ncbi:MAG: glycolate oxidase subunit GlcE [Rhodospirillales bacterium]|nr:glycolate oxidase subunit GlcE [Rhodospirillales bacterium]